MSEEQSSNSGCGIILFLFLLLFNIIVLVALVDKLSKIANEHNDKLQQLIELQQQMLDLQKQQSAQSDTLLLD